MDIPEFNFFGNIMENLRIIPRNWHPTNFYSFGISGFEKFKFTSDDLCFQECVDVLSASLKCFIDLRKETHAFTEPQLYYKPNEKSMTIKIGIMENEHYDMIENSLKDLGDTDKTY